MKYLIILSLIIFSSLALAETKTELVFKASDKPWLTNKPYMDDEYSQARAKAYIKLQQKTKLLIKKECKRDNGLPIWGCGEKLRKEAKSKFKLPKRGTLKYVQKKYIYMKDDLKKHGKSLKALLSNLDELSLHTRSVSVYEKEEVGELTYQEVRKEICLIEKHVGFFPKKKYCNAY